VEDSRREHDARVVNWVNDLDLLSAKVLAAHCVHIDQDEMRIMRRHGTHVAHNPTSNLKLASGIAPIQEMLDRGLKVGIGTDGTASNNDLDMFDEMRLAAFLAKGSTGDPTALPARQALTMATRMGAEALFLGDITGSLEAGKRADLKSSLIAHRCTTPPSSSAIPMLSTRRSCMRPSTTDVRRRDVRRPLADARSPAPNPDETALLENRDRVRRANRRFSGRTRGQRPKQAGGDRRAGTEGELRDSTQNPRGRSEYLSMRCWTSATSRLCAIPTTASNDTYFIFKDESKVGCATGKIIRSALTGLSTGVRTPPDL
jgi:hypothetical protein